MNAAPKTVDGIKCEFRTRVAIITINQPKKLGALNQDQYFSIAQWLRHIDAREDIHVTVLTGTGRFFSAGADVQVAGKATAAKEDQFKHILQSFVANNLNITHAFYTHRKILVTALNGPVVGLSAALVGHSDFVYAAPHAYLLCPFTSLGLVAEGLASRAMNSRLGPARGPEALLMSKRITGPELLQCGFVNKVFDTKPDEHEKFLELVLEEVDTRLGPHLVPNSLVKIKEMMKAPERDLYDAQGVKEVMGGLDVFVRGIPQAEFRKIANGEKRHKL